MAAKVSKKKGKAKLCEKLKEIEVVTEETCNIIKLLQKEPIIDKEEKNVGVRQDSREISGSGS